MTENERAVLVKMPPTLKRKLARAARASGMSLNDVIVTALAGALGVPFEQSGRAGHSISDAPNVLVRMPLELKRALQLRALNRETNLSAEILAELSRQVGARLFSGKTVRRSPFGGGRSVDVGRQTSRQPAAVRRSR